MSYPINYPTPQGANVQIFCNDNRAPSTTSIASAQDWVKPQGASFVWFTLIGAGAGGLSSTGGGSGAVTNFMCPAFLIPNILRISVGGGGTNGSNGGTTSIVYQQKDANGYTLLSANGGTAGSSGGTAMTANAFTAIGFFQSIAGQAGVSGGQSVSSTTFLSGGSGNTGLTSNYGYTVSASRNGYFQTQPIIVGTGGPGEGNGGIGCGAGSTGGNGGPGLAVIITW